jgi:hypothetical protein
MSTRQIELDDLQSGAQQSPSMPLRRRICRTLLAWSPIRRGRLKTEEIQ